MTIKQIVMTGMKEFDNKLKDMETKAGNRIARATIGAGLTQLKKSIKAAAPEWMKASIGARQGKNPRKGVYEAKAGVNVGKRTKKSARNWNAWVPVAVLGTMLRRRKSIGGKFSYITNPTQAQLSTGQIKPHPIVKQGLAAAKGSMTTAMQAAFDRALAKEVAKAQLKGK